MVNLTVPGNSILTMPLPETKAAPEKFRGKYNKIKSFLIHYELLLEQNNVLAEKDKCELVTRYCSRKVTEFIQALPSYSDKKWDNLKSDLLKYYDADLDNKKYKVLDLVKMVKGCKEKKMKNLSAWREYGRKFITIGGWLLKKNKISDEEYATYYWNGIPKALRIKLENRLLARNPTRSLSTPFRVDEINEGVEALLQRDRFDMNFAGSDDEQDSDDDEAGINDSSESEEEDELRRLRRRIRKKARYSKKKQSVSDSEDSEDEEEISTIRNKAGKDMKRKINGKEEPEIEALIRQLNAMSVDDPGYAGLVFRALKIDPEVMKVIRPPVFVSKPTIPHAPTYPRTPQQFQQQNSLHMTPRFPPPKPFARRPPDEDSCFACEKRGHRMSTCPEMKRLEDKKMVTKNRMGRYVFNDGRPIRRLQGETLVDAICNNDLNTQEKLQSHLIRVVEQQDKEHTNEVYYGNLDSDTSSDEEYYHGVCINGSDSYNYSDDEGCEETLLSAAVIGSRDSDSTRFAYPVTRSGKTTSAKRREAMEAEYQNPKARRQNKSKENEVRGMMKGIPSKNDQVTAPVVKEPPKNVSPSETKMQVPVPIVSSPRAREDKGNKNGRDKIHPVDTRAPEYNGRHDDAIMEDITNPQHVKHNKHLPGEAQEKARPRNATSATSPILEKHTRQSEVSAQVKTVGVLNQVLNTRIDLAIGEVLGISKDLSALLGDKIKLKSSKLPNTTVASLPIATSFYSKKRGLLIQLHMQCDDRPITAIIDTGSQLNIVKKSICDSKIMRPIDNKVNISIADANGGQGKLEGMVANVPLNCGEVSTKADLYVGAHVPFELLLGRPWQRQNYVSIDERLNGTYLLFKDHKTLEPRYEILVSVDRAAPEIQYELPVWNVPEPSDDLQSYLVRVDHDQSTAPVYAPPPLNELPFSDSKSSMILHTPYSSPTLQSSSISIQEDATHTTHQVLEIPNEFSKVINTKKKHHETVPDPDCSCSQSMPNAPQPNFTENQSGLSISPLGSSPFLRLDSEILTTSIADLPFLRRSQSVHPLILSTSDGALLGTLQDPIGNKHIDLVFLNAGLFNLSESPISVTPTSAFVRLFPELGNGPIQPWILPYLNKPPAEVMFDEKSKKYTLPTEPLAPADQTTSGKPKSVTGEPMRDLPKFLPTRLKALSIPQLAGIPELDDTNLSLAKSAKEELTDSTYVTNKSPNTENESEHHNSILSTPPDTPPHLLNVSNESSLTASPYGKDSDSQDEQTMDVDPDEEMEWDVLKKDISDELNKANIEEEMAKEVEKAKSRKERVDEQIYKRIREAYVITTGGPPTDETMNQLQDAYIALMEEHPQVSPRNNIPNPTIDPNASIAQSLAKNSATTNPHISKYTPRISSPLASAEPTLFRPPEPSLVFVVQTASSTDKSEEEMDKILPRTPQLIERAKEPVTSTGQYQSKQSEQMNQDDNSNTDLEPTRPSSPIAIRENPFQRIRKVGRERIIASLEAEIEFLHREAQTTATEDPGKSKEYEQRLRETIAHLHKMSNERVGEIDPFRIFMVGLMLIINLADTILDLSSPLLPDSPPLAPTEPAETTYNKEIIPQCPSQPPVSSDPRSINIAERPYYTGGACDFVKKAAGIQTNLIVDTRSLTIVEDGNHIPPSTIRHFTELSGALSSYIFPGRLAPTYDWPLDVEESKAKNFRERIQELREARRKIEIVYQKANRKLSRGNVTECLRPHITLYKRISPGSPQLTPIKMDRIYFWQRIHPVWNPLLKPIEAAFLRGAVYALYGEGQINEAEQLEGILRTPHFDDWEVRELVALGALDSEFREDEALAYFKALDDEHWAFHAQEEAFRNSANEILADMESEMDAEDESDTLAASESQSMRRTDCSGFPNPF